MSDLTLRHLRLPDEQEALRDLRRRTLYAGLPEGKALYAGDELPTTLHVGAFDGERLVGIASLFAREDGTLQLRGMAVDADQQGKGVGAAIVRYAEQVSAERGYPELWCNARLKAVGFYSRLGWQVEGHQFEVPDVGPHFVMRKQTPRTDPIQM